MQRRRPGSIYLSSKRRVHRVTGSRSRPVSEPRSMIGTKPKGKNMSNALTVNQANAFEQYGSAAASRTLGTILRFTKFGEYQDGIDGAMLKVGTELVAVMQSLTVGFIRWSDGKPAEQQMGLIADGFIPPTRSALGDIDKSLW